MTFQVAWGRNAGAATVTTVAELDAVLDSVRPASDHTAFTVEITATHIPPADLDPPLLQVCIGHPDRSFVYHIAPDGSSAWGYEPGLEPRDGLYSDYGGVVDEAWPERTRVSPATARQAAREFVTHNARRPTCLHWDTEDDE